MNEKRTYTHGDKIDSTQVSSTRPELEYYCAFCDMFDTYDHLMRNECGGAYESGYDRAKRGMKAVKSDLASHRYFRPTNAENLFL